MPFDGIDINHSNYDINIPNTSLKEMKTQKTGDIEDAISEINSRLELDNLKIELPKTKEQQEKEVLELVKVRGLRKSFENNRFDGGVYINKVQDGVFALIPKDTGNVNYFINNKGEVLLSIGGLKERPFLENGRAFKDAGYIEKKEDGLYNMYKVVDGKELGPIDINSPEYYKAWNDIIFYADIANKLVSLNFNNPETKKGIEVLIDGGSFKFEDLEEFLKRKLITQEIFDYGIKEMQKVIVSQCSDERLINTTGFNGESLGIKESDLKKYLEQRYISQEIAKECYNLLPSKMKNLSK